jgi:trigger factor
MSATSVKYLDPAQVELEIAISPEELEAARERVFHILVKQAKIPGFRPGKAPRKLFEAQYGSQGIAERAIEDVLPRVYSQALRENDLDPLDQPEWELLPQEGGEPLRVQATVLVRPHIELQAYTDILVPAPRSTATDEEVEKTLAKLRRSHATYMAIDRPVQLGDVPTLDYEGKIDGVTFEGGKAENHPTEIAEGPFIAGVVEGIVGMKAGETKDVKVYFPEEYGRKELAGKPVVFTITVHENKVPQLPDLDDDFARRFSSEGTLASLRADLRARLNFEAEHRARESVKALILEQLIERHEVFLPQALVDREAESILVEMKNRVTQGGLSWEAYLAETSKTDELLADEHLTEARRRVKLSLLLGAIAKRERIEATKEDIDAALTVLSQQYGRHKHEVEKMLHPNKGAFIEGIIQRKTVDFLVSRSARDL